MDYQLDGYLYRSQKPSFIIMHSRVQARHSGRDCRNPDHMDVKLSAGLRICAAGKLPFMVVDTRIPAGMRDLHINRTN